ncbi:uncharacterized protein LOC108039691 [Drosophila rhopaloa]|uniref:RRM domain-containing protein n=1 Tax=Drosophila rhopaloa TaxID=1041015 RepID=A0ABM5GZL7_DRORH|nr:uncharacterized protein LOC108039691 [Drosophila rhopaloa]
MEMASAYKLEAAFLKGHQAEASPYQPGTVVIQPPKRLPPEAENGRRMYIPDLDQAITHREVFNYFCNFGDLERVCVKNGTDNLNYAMVLFSRTSSMEQAIKSNPHTIKGHRLNCRKANERSKNKTSKQPFGFSNKQRESCRKPGTNPIKPPNPPVWQLKKKESKRSNQQKLKKSSKPLRRSERRQQMNKKVAPRKSDRTYVYAVTTKDRVSRWSFKLCRCTLSPDEKSSRERGMPQAAQILLDARPKKAVKFTTLNAPNSPGTSSDSKPKSPNLCLAPSLPSLLNHSPLVPLPKSVIPEPSKPDLRSVILSTLGQDYVHHCYTNVEAYRRSKCYIDLLPEERMKRPTVKEYVDQIYGEKENKWTDI